MKKLVRVLLLGLLSYSFVGQLAADPIGDLKNFYNSYGGAINISSGSVLQSQRSGHYTAGGVSSRTPSAYLQPISVAAPGFRFGCSGIDAHFGSLSHIKSPELKRFMNTIMASGMNYAFMIGLETLCPMCKKTVDQLNKIATEINGMGINACNASASALGGLLPQSQASSQYLCPQIAMSGGFADYAAARQGCFSEGKSTQILNEARADPAKKELVEQFLVDKGNLAWMVLKKRTFSNRSSEDDALRELVMSFSGSLILQEANASAKRFAYLPSLAGDKSLYDAMLHGGTTIIYRCDEHKDCLNPTRDDKHQLTISQSQSFSGLVTEHLLSIKEKLLKDEGEYSAAEIKLIESTRKVPLAKALSAQASHSFVFEIIDLTQYAEIIAVDMLEEYLDELLDTLRLGVAQINLGKEEALKFQQNLKEAKRALHYRRTKTEQETSLAFDFIQKVQLIENLTADELSADFLQMAEWSVRSGV